MASLRVLAFDHEGRPIQFDTWLDDLQLYLLSDSRDSVSLFDLVSGTTPSPPATANSAACSQWLTRNAAARLAICNHLPLAECAHFRQHRTAHALYDTVNARYSSPATTGLGRLLLPYLFPELSAFATIEDLVSHLRTSDARYRAATPAEFLDRNQPPMFITLYFIATHLPDSLRSVRDHFLSLDPTTLTIDLLEQYLFAAETSVVDVGASRGTPHTPFFEGCSPSPLAPSYASAAAVDVPGAVDVRAASASVKRRSGKGKGGRGGGGGSRSGGGGSGGGGGGSGGGGSSGSGDGSGGFGGSGGGNDGSGGSGGGGRGGGRTGAQGGGSGGGQRQQQQLRSETQSPQQLREWLFQRGAPGGSVSCPYVIRTGDRAGQTCGRLHTQRRCFSRLDDAWRIDAEGDCYWCVLPDPGIDAAALGASESVLPGTAPAEALHTFTLDSGARSLPVPPLSSRILQFCPSHCQVFMPLAQFYHLTSRRVFPSQDVTFDEPVPFYRLFPYRSAPPPPPPLFLALGPPPVDPLPPLGPAPSGAARGVVSGGAASGGAEPGVAESEGAVSRGAEPGGEEPGGAEPAGVEPGGAEPEGVEPGDAELEGAESGGAEPQGAASSGGPAATGAGGAGAAGARGAAVTTGAGGTGGTATTGPGGARTKGTGAAGTGGVGGAGAGDPTEPGGAGARGSGAGGAGAGGTGAGGAGAGGAGVGGTGARGAGAGDTAAGGAGVGGTSAGGAGAGGAGAVDPGGTVRPRPYFVPLLQQSVVSLIERREPASCPVSPVRTARRVPHLRPPLVPSTHAMALRPSSVPLRVPLPPPPESSLPAVPDPESDHARAASPTVSRLLATTDTGPSFESAAASALVAELLHFAVACRLDYATALVAESASATPPSGTAMDAKMASWKSTGTYVDEIPPPGVNIVDGMWIFRVKRPPGSPPAFKMTTLRVLMHIAAQRDYELHSLDLSTTFLQGSLHEEIWLRRPLGFTGSFPAGTQWSLRWPVYGLRQAPREWHDTLKTTLVALGFAPSTADPSLFLRTDTSLSPFYVLVYVEDLVFATADTEALTLVKSELQKRHTCTDLGELRSYLGLQITQDKARRTITLTQSHMVHQSVEPSGPYPELVGCLMYLMTCTRPYLAYPLNLLARYVSPCRHRKVHWDAAKRVLRYLCSTTGMGLVLGGRGPFVLNDHADASWVDDSAMQWSSQSYTFSLGSSSVSWRSTCSSSVLNSSCEAEIYGGAMAAQELRLLTYLLTDLGEQPHSPPVLYVDNKAMIALCQEHRLEHRTKHIALLYFLARELQQRGQLRLAYVATRANTADIFTKALLPGDHQRFSIVLGLVPTLPHLLIA
ncbi:unnamed protein product [Closterium sp. NIES-53]